MHKEKLHRIDVHLPGEIYKELKSQPDGITTTVTQALTQYLHNGTTRNTQDLHTEDSRELVKHQQMEIYFLQQELMRVHSEICAMMVTKNSLLGKVWLKLKGHKEE